VINAQQSDGLTRLGAPGSRQVSRRRPEMLDVSFWFKVFLKVQVAASGRK